MPVQNLTQKTEKFYSISQAAKLTQLSANVIRKWETEGRLPRARRAANGYRVYTQDDIEIIKNLKNKIEREQLVFNQHRLMAVKKVSKKLTGNKWEKVVRAIDKGEHVEIFIKPEDTKIAGLLVMGMEKNREVTFINIVGEIDLALLGKLGAKFNIPNLDQVIPEAESSEQ